MKGCSELGGGTESSYLDAVITVSEVVHRFVLLVDDANARLVGADDHFLDVYGLFPACLQLRVNVFCPLDGSLGVEFRCSECQPIPKWIGSDWFTWI